MKPMGFFRKILGLKEHRRDALVLVCSNCRLEHVLAKSSFMMSPQQLLALLRGSGALVLEAGAVSREYTVGELRTFPDKAQRDLKTQTVVAIAEASIGIRKGQELTWACWTCKYDQNTFPDHWRGNGSEQPKEWPYPSDGFFREASKRLVADHGDVIRVTDCGSLSAVRWRITYKDGHEIVVGNPGWPQDGRYSQSRLI
jgi:hypothetical protein